jgi:outer membrane protein assembly factor BamB
MVCGSGQAALASSWPTFAGSAERLGYNGNETILNSNSVPNLVLHWKMGLGGHSATQPLYIEQNKTHNGTHDEVFTTSGAAVLALNATTGQIDWKAHLPTSQAQNAACVPVGLGILGTPTINPDARLLYVVDGNGALHALHLGDGKEDTGYPVQVIDPVNLSLGSFNHSSPTLVGGKIFITTSGRPVCEGVGSPYFGGVIAFDRKTKTVEQSFFPVSVNTGGGGIWGPGGVLYDEVTDRLFVATGNALAVPDGAPLAESVVALSGKMKVLDSFTPGPPLLKPNSDADFGSTPTPVDVQGCPPLLAALNKTGNMFVFQRNNLAAGATQILDISNGGGHGTLIGMAAYDPTTQMLFVNNPLSSKDGLFTNGAIAFQETSPSCTLNLAWQTTYGDDVFKANTRSTDPVVAGGVVWLVTGDGNSVLALNEMTGAPLWSSGSSITTPTVTPVMVEDGQMFVQDHNYIYAWGL